MLPALGDGWLALLSADKGIQCVDGHRLPEPKIHGRARFGEF